MVEIEQAKQGLFALTYSPEGRSNNSKKDINALNRDAAKNPFFAFHSIGCYIDMPDRRRLLLNALLIGHFLQRGTRRNRQACPVNLFRVDGETGRRASLRS